MKRTVTVNSPYGNDKGKAFTLTEMDAFSCEEWGRQAISAVYRCASASDQGMLSFISEGIRDAFTAPVMPDIRLPSDGSMKADSPQFLQAQADAKEAAESEKEDERNASPTQMAAILGIRLFLQLPFEEQRTALRPLLGCIKFDLMGTNHPVTQDGRVTDVARTYIEDPRTILWLQVEAFKLHTDFFTPAVHSIYSRVMAAAATRSPATSQEPSPQP